ncbi:MAG: caspase family protein, partial [Planctomycetia bacterium]|nr:caspase family protein [Planctomycetia bacterium]
MDKHAVLVGINKYQNLGNLSFAVQDAQAFARSLERNYGFTPEEITILSSEATEALRPQNRASIKRQLDRVRERCLAQKKPLDLLIFGFWGHGLWAKDAHGVEGRYLCPYDLDETEDYFFDTALPMADIQAKLCAIPARNTWLLLDCCQNVLGGARGAGELMPEQELRVLENLSRDIGLQRLQEFPTDEFGDLNGTTLIFNACSKGQKAYEWSEKEHGLFTHYVLEAMEERLPTAAAIFKNAQSAMPSNPLSARQTPFSTSEGGLDIPLPAVKNGLDAFISYRRSGGPLAPYVHTLLEKRKFRSFLDVNEKMVGAMFDERILDRIAESNVFVIVLTDGFFERHDAMSDEDWVYREIKHAIEHRKPIVPYFADNFKWDKNPPPARAAWLTKVDGIVHHPIYFDAAMDRLVGAIRNPSRLSDYDDILSQLTQPFVPREKQPFVPREKEILREPPVACVTVPDDTRSLQEAYDRVSEGGEILIHPGTYDVPETIVITKDIKIRGEGEDASKIVLRGGSNVVFKLESGFAELEGLTIQNEMEQLLDVGEEEILEMQNSALWIRSPRSAIRRCRVTSTYGFGIMIDQPDSAPHLQECTVSGCGGPNLCVRYGANPTVERCRFTDGKQGGIFVYDGASGTFTDCEASRNALA